MSFFFKDAAITAERKRLIPAVYAALTPVLIHIRKKSSLRVAGVQKRAVSTFRLLLSVPHGDTEKHGDHRDVPHRDTEGTEITEMSL